jgi:hypothetical protein
MSSGLAAPLFIELPVNSRLDACLPLAWRVK